MFVHKMAEEMVLYLYMSYIKYSCNYILLRNSDHRYQVKILSFKS